LRDGPEKQREIPSASLRAGSSIHLKGGFVQDDRAVAICGEDREGLTADGFRSFENYGRLCRRKDSS
jgi:hypothetical protein